MNYFSPQHTAERYAKGRPYFHDNTIKRVKDVLKLETKLENALDIACGTGLSTQALLEIAQHVYGTDTSSEMLKWALQADKIHYSIAPAEKQPFENEKFDLITVCSGVHWFDIELFSKEAHRLLKNDAWLVLYDNFFISEMEDVPAFNQWFPEVYLKEFPSPPRNDQYEWTKDNLATKKFNIVQEEQFKNPISYTKEALVLYFTTQSNITAAVERGQADYVTIEKWLHKELTVFFGKKQERVIHYGNWVKYLQKMT